MPLQRFTSEVLEVKQITPTVKHIVFSAPDDFDFKPGQFVSISMDLPDGKLKRMYSIASPPLKGSVEICIKKIDGGPGSTFLHNLNEHEKVDMVGPFGTFVLKETTKPLVFIATGTGIAPFRSMIQALLKKEHNRQIILLTGVRHQNEILYQDEFLLLEQKYKNFKYYNTVSRPVEPYTGHRGRVQTLVEEVIPKGFDCNVYLCGLSPMITDITRLLANKEIKKDQIHFERYD